MILVSSTLFFISDVNYVPLSILGGFVWMQRAIIFIGFMVSGQFKLLISSVFVLGWWYTKVSPPNIYFPKVVFLMAFAPLSWSLNQWITFYGNAPDMLFYYLEKRNKRDRAIIYQSEVWEKLLRFHALYVKVPVSLFTIGYLHASTKSKLHCYLGYEMTLWMLVHSGQTLG